jgi:hypothetical protein
MNLVFGLKPIHIIASVCPSRVRDTSSFAVSQMHMSHLSTRFCEDLGVRDCSNVEIRQCFEMH